MALSPLIKLSPNYTVADFIKSDKAKELGVNNLPPESMLSNLKNMAGLVEKIEKKHGPINIVSGYRNAEVNKAVGGSSTSKHTLGEAIDFYPRLDTAQNFWLDLISDVELMPKMGEISWKTHQNTIHITLPYGITKGSARVADQSGYYRTETDYGKSILQKFGIGEQPLIAKAGMGIGMIAMGAGALVLALALRRR